MTQTIHKETCNTEDFVSVEIYHHPNSANKCNIENGTARYCYTCHAEKFTIDEFYTYVKDSIDLSEEWGCEELKLIADCFFKSQEDFIWKTHPENGHDDYGSFFATKEEAEQDLYEQMC